LVTDVFALDTLTEMLESPLQLLSYLNLRARFSEKIMAMHEHTILSYHLRGNLWVSEDTDHVQLGDDIAVDLDVAMSVRREGVPGSATPDGILTRLEATRVGRLLVEIESEPSPNTIGLGLLLLQMNEESIESLNQGIETITAQSMKDGRPHDVTIGVSGASSGVTIHCSILRDAAARERLLGHCLARKYTEKANSWYGMATRPEDGSIRFGVCFDFPWQQDPNMEEGTRNMEAGQNPRILRRRSFKRRKIGRNSMCPCGSGKKYKHCCGKR